jgi:hypothetical protein
MVHTSKKIAVLALLGVGLVIGKTASADSITQTFTIPTQTVPFSNPFTFNLFDSTLGTLNSVNIFLGTSATASVNVFNTDPGGAPQSFTNATATIPITATGPAGITVTDTLVAGPFSGTTNSGFLSEKVFPGVTGSTSNNVNVPSLDFGSYEGVGGGTSSLTAASSAGTYGGSGTNVAFSGSATASGDVVVTYVYTPFSAATPEPGTWGLLVAGASTGLVLVRRRRMRK